MMMTGGQPKRRRRPLPTDVFEFDTVMKEALGRVPEGSCPEETIEAAVDDVLANYTVRPHMVERFVRDGLYEIIKDLLFPEQEEEADPELIAALDTLIADPGGS